jgi:hypothetical protein
MSVPFFCKNCLKRLEHNRPGVCGDCHSKVSAQMPAREYMRPVQEREVLGQISQYQGQMPQGVGVAARALRRADLEQANAAAAFEQAQAAQEQADAAAALQRAHQARSRAIAEAGRTRFQARAFAEAGKNRRDAAVALLEMAAKADAGQPDTLKEIREQLYEVTGGTSTRVR